MSTALQAIDTRYGFTPEQVDVIKATIAPGASNEELALFLMVCQKKGLDPFSRQIYLSERRSFDADTQQWVIKKSPETTIDGFRVIAERSGKYEGQLGPFWCGPDGEWKDVWLGSAMPSAAKIAVLRHGFREPVWAVALFEEYVQTKKDGTPNKMWQKMGANQLAKCAESLALRKAFPSDLSGMYTGEEMAQSRKESDNESDEASRQAQQQVVQRKIKELSSPITPATIIELADSLDVPPEPPLLAPEVRKPPKKEKPPSAMTETAKKRWLQAKMQLRAVTGSDKYYYTCIYPNKHCTEIATPEEARRIWALLQAGLIPQGPSAADKALKLEVETHALRIGALATQAALGRRGLQSVDEVLTLGGDELDALLRELRETA